MANLSVPQDLHDYLAVFREHYDLADLPLSASPADGFQEWCKRSLATAWRLHEFPHNDMLLIIKRVSETNTSNKKDDTAILQTVLQKLAARLTALATGEYNFSKAEPEARCLARTKGKLLVFWVCQLLQALNKVQSYCTKGQSRPTSPSQRRNSSRHP